MGLSAVGSSPEARMGRHGGGERTELASPGGRCVLAALQTQTVPAISIIANATSAAVCVAVRRARRSFFCRHLRPCSSFSWDLHKI
jgi:hypothetical protein